MVAGPLLVLLALSGVVLGRNVPQNDGDERLETPPSNFVGEGTNDLATTLLKGFVPEEKDFVFSPLGYSVVLAILAEGARGRSRNQLVEALHLPEDTYAVRQNYKAILETMRDRWTTNKPEFKNWFYVYKNYTVEDAYKKVLLENYFTEVKTVNRVHYELNFDKDEEEEKNEHKEEVDNEEDLLAVEKNEDKQENTKEDLNKKDESAEETKKEKKKDEKSEETKKEDKAEKVNDEEAEKNQDETVEKKEDKRPLESFDASKDVTSALTANRILDRDSQELDAETKMIIFNGFYFRGNWKTPFKLCKDDEKQSFYKSAEEKKKAAMMQTSGLFDIGEVPELDAVALELPYEGNQYSMLVLLPKQKDGLNKLTSDLAGFSLNKVYKYLVNRQVNILLPKYQIQTISHPEKILQQNGINDIFTSDADLSGISADKLKMGALVQLVNVFIDEGSADSNFLTSTSVEDLRLNADEFAADHPFLFFIRDQTKNVLVAAGKVTDPKFESDFKLAP